MEYPLDEDKPDPCKIWIGNLNVNRVKEIDLVRLTAQYGKLKDFQLPVNKEGTPLGFFVVTYTNERDAKIAINSLNGLRLNDRKLIVETARSGFALNEREKQKLLLSRKIREIDSKLRSMERG